MVESMSRGLLGAPVEDTTEKMGLVKLKSGVGVGSTEKMMLTSWMRVPASLNELACK